MFDAELEDIIWSVTTENFKLAQFRVYELDSGANAKAINDEAGGEVGFDADTSSGFDAPGSTCGVLGMLSFSLGLVGITGLRLRRKRFSR